MLAWFSFVYINQANFFGLPTALVFYYLGGNGTEENVGWQKINFK